MKTFFQTMKSAVYDPDFYRGVVHNKQGGFGYFFKLILLLSLVYTVALGVKLVPAIGPGWAKLSEAVVKEFPSDLVVKFANGEISTNVQEPYIIANPDAGNDAMRKDHANIIVIDTNSDASLAALDRYDTYVLVTKHTIAFRDENKAQVRIQDVSGFGAQEFELSRAFIEEMLKNVQPYLKLVAPIVLTVVYAGTFVANIAILIWALFGALIVMFFLSRAKLASDFGTSYAVTLYLLTLPLAVDEFFSILGLFMDSRVGVPFLFTLIFVALAFTNIKPMFTAEPPKAAHPSA